MTDMLVPPVAPKRFGVRVRSIHGDYIDDGWDWLRDETDPAAIAHLRAENEWADHICAPTRGLADRIEADVKARAALFDVSAPVRNGDYWYYCRFEEGKSYAIHCRLRAAHGPLDFNDPVPSPDPRIPLDGESVLVDENALAEGEEFFRLADLVPSPDGRLIAWARDTAGDERYTWVIQEASTGRVIDEAVCDAGYGLAWSADSAWVLYTGLDTAWRQCEVWAHRLGTPMSEDLLLLTEPDGRFDLWFDTSADPDHVVIHSTSTTSGRAWLWLPASPTMIPLPLVDLVEGRQVGVEPAGDHLLIVHTATSKEGSLAAAPLPVAPSPRMTAGPERRRALVDPASVGGLDRAPLAPSSAWVSIREAQPGERIVSVAAHEHFCAVSMRSGSLTQVEYRERVLALQRDDAGMILALDAAHLGCAWGPGRFVDVESPTRTIQVAPGSRFEDRQLRVSYQSTIVPETTLVVDPASGERRVLHVQDAPGWDPSVFVEERVWVTARDGRTQIPVTLVHRADATADGSNAGWQIGYGSYEISYDPQFEILRLPILERGVVMAIAHIRGGGEMGRAWYEAGKERVKVTTFTDFIDVAHWLVESGWVATDRLVAEGRSAGGLLMGAVLNMAPESFRVIVAGVPFVDALTTILDPSLPLTVGEWEEWGNPIDDPEIFAIMKSYTPYENVPEGVRLPAVMATTSVNDTRVGFVEPTKWVQRLREASGHNDDEDAAHARPIVLRTQMVAGHAGPSGRQAKWTARAEEFAFALAQVTTC
ncbi:S9 family peptidase [Actinomyces mediterranea]|uniref:S9 family peptidase n=1 Tax=Actinomyces mediterranea TaxID=1871028 RepID=UPI000971037A|nr:prolyl oligopeptidase family serine peptidase [Actinomyces mediterranea]